MPPELEIVQEREIMIYASMSGAAQVKTTDGTLIADLAPEQGGFIAGVGRVLERERAKVGALGSDPIRLIKYTNGNIALRDDVTGWRAELMGFGRDNATAFYRLLED
jgi:putative photosynthetic complex assembly protein